MRVIFLLNKCVNIVDEVNCRIFFLFVVDVIEKGLVFCVFLFIVLV